MTLHFTNARLIDPEAGTDQHGCLTVAQGRIVAIDGPQPGDADYRLGPGVHAILSVIFQGAVRHDGFGNARYSRTLFEQAIHRQALRLSGRTDLNGLERHELTTLDGEDFAEAARLLD